MSSRALIALLVVCGACAERRAPEGEACMTCPSIHPVGIADPASPDFHAVLVRETGWDLGACARCHGDDFGGGTAGAPCTGCHTRGPDACDTCHGDPPASAAHPAHAVRACNECHVVPARWDDPGHVLGDSPPADVVLAQASWDAKAQQCTGGCHGQATPVWTNVGAGEAACGTCHGVPPAGHVDDRCEACHPSDRHIDGFVDVGREPGCGGCHADLGGAHRSHVEARHRLRGPIACDECHGVPTATLDEGHIDSGPPAEVTLADGAWEAADGTCSGTACHGLATPTWTRVGADEAACGTCHGIPPASHGAGLALTDCAGCHRVTVDEYGNILRSGPPGAETSEHIDGELDL